MTSSRVDLSARPAAPPVALAQRLEAGTYAGYAYAYPHKTSYRPLAPAVDASKLWQSENRDALFLYVHVPFCEMRCGFCNLFTTIGAGEDAVAATLRATQRQSRQLAQAVDPGRITQAAFGGGTPSYLSTAQLEKLFATLEAHWPLVWADAGTSFEVSPGTVDPTKLAFLRSVGVNRISMGVQSFVKDDLKAMARPQRTTEVAQACEWIAEKAFDQFNLDLIYGTANQRMDDWLDSVRHAVDHGATELYLYPLYVRELTGLGRTGRLAGEHRRELYRAGRDLLLDLGYEQHSMRYFQRPMAVASNGDYDCQTDGMIGLGPGARSYTSGLHYSSEYAVGQPGVRAIIDEFNRTDDFTEITYGTHLDRQEQQRRFVIKGILRTEGVNLSGFSDAFGVDLFDALPELHELFDLGLAEHHHTETVVLTELGFEHSDTIGPWLYSVAVSDRMGAYELV